MEILEKGIFKNYYSTRCMQCGSLIKFQDTEETSVMRDTYFGARESRHINCPVCGDRIHTMLWGQRVVKRYYSFENDN